jgi:hypothetical protein
MSPKDYKYKAFISYPHQDKQWETGKGEVRDLLPRI